MAREIHKVQHNGRTVGYVRQFRKDWGLALTIITDDPERDPGQFLGFHPSREIAEAELKAWAKTVYERLQEVFQ